jgi:hypothetical protein
MVRPRAGILACAVALLAAPPTAAMAADAPTIRAYRVIQPLRLDEGQTSTYTLGCRGRDVVTDGTWLVDDLATNPQIDDEPFDLVTGVDVLAAEALSRSAYRFTVRNNAEGAAQIRIAVTCLGARVGGHELRVSDRRTRVAALPAGTSAGPALDCPRGTVAIAPGFALGAPLAAPRLTARAIARASARRVVLSFTAAEPATVRTSGRCLRRATTRADGHRHRLRTTLRVGETDVADGRVETFTISCRADEHPLLGSFRLGGSWHLGQLPAGRQRSFKIQSPPDGESADAALGLLCLDVRA